MNCAIFFKMLHDYRLCSEDRLLFEDMIQEPIKTALESLHPGEACICSEARYRYNEPDFISITGD